MMGSDVAVAVKSSELEIRIRWQADEWQQNHYSAHYLSSMQCKFPTEVMGSATCESIEVGDMLQSIVLHLAQSTICRGMAHGIEISARER